MPPLFDVPVMFPRYFLEAHEHNQVEGGFPDLETPSVRRQINAA